MSVRKALKELIPPKLVTVFRKIKVGKKYKSEKYLLKFNNEFKNIHKGERCFIIGNGPSLKNIDLSVLKNEVTFTVNQLSRRSDFEQIRTNYHVWADERFFEIDDSKPEDLELLETMRKVKTKDNSPIVFYKLPAYKMINKYHLDKSLNIRYFMEAGYGIESNSNFNFCKLIPGFPTVVQYIVLLAIYMGCSEIYLLGCDCTGIVNTIQSKLKDLSVSDYGYQITENEKKRMQKFHSKYSIENELRWYANLFDEYGKLNEFCNKKNVRLYNATETSLLECIPKINLNDVLGDKK